MKTSNKDPQQPHQPQPQQPQESTTIFNVDLDSSITSSLNTSSSNNNNNSPYSKKCSLKKIMSEDPDWNSLGAGVVRKEVDLTPSEKHFLSSVERGDIPTVQKLLADNSNKFDFNANCVDPLGRTALAISIEYDNIEMLDVLLKSGLHLGDSLLQAINEDNVEATQMILNHEKKLQMQKLNIMTGSMESQHSNTPVLESIEHVIKDRAAKITAKWKKLTVKKWTSTESRDDMIDPDVPNNNSCFTPDITPIILAAQRDNYEITKILLDRGDSISKPHDIRCSCDDCVSRTSGDSLNHSMSRINAYRALASPSLIALSSKDPILTAFELSWELRRLSKLENELKIEYEVLAKQCQNFAVDLLDQVRGSKELEVLLNFDKYGPVRGSGDRMALARLKLAIKYKQKKFVSHANCQQLLASIWYEGLLGFRRRHIIFKILLTMLVSLLFPILSVIYIISPKSSAGQFMRRPFIKFICHSASYMTFLFLLILASQRIKSIISLSKETDDKSAKLNREVRGAPPTSIEWMILAYVAGLVWAEIKQLWDQGLKSYVHDMWNILDFTTNSLYIATYTLKLVAYIKVEAEKRNYHQSAYADRKHWDAYDPTLISEGLFASANIFSCLKLIYIFTVNPHLGPLQISLGRMVIDILKFLFIALLVCFSYSCGVNQLYWYYAEVKSRECNLCEATRLNVTSVLNLNKSVLGSNLTMDKMAGTIPDCHLVCDRSIANLFEIIQTLYFAIYGLVELSKFELKDKHVFTQFVGKLMFGTYLGIMTIVLINMLIAMLSSSFQKISDDADTEWKFARSRLWMSYFEEGGTVPPPFNIIPTPKTLWYLIKWLFDRMCRFSKKAKTNKWHSLKKAVKKMQERDVVYQSVIFDLVKRYIMKRQKKTSDGVSEDDMNELKQDLSSFRYELLDILRSNGMNIPQPNINVNNQCQSNRLRRKNSRISSLNKLCSQESWSSTHPHHITNMDLQQQPSLHQQQQQQQQQQQLPFIFQCQPTSNQQPKNLQQHLYKQMNENKECYSHVKHSKKIQNQVMLQQLKQNIIFQQQQLALLQQQCELSDVDFDTDRDVDKFKSPSGVDLVTSNVYKKSVMKSCSSPSSFSPTNSTYNEPYNVVDSYNIGSTKSPLIRQRSVDTILLQLDTLEECVDEEDSFNKDVNHNDGNLTTTNSESHAGKNSGEIQATEKDSSDKTKQNSPNNSPALPSTFQNLNSRNTSNVASYVNRYNTNSDNNNVNKNNCNVNYGNESIQDGIGVLTMFQGHHSGNYDNLIKRSKDTYKHPVTVFTEKL